VSARKKSAPPFPTGLSAHKKCTTCGERYHVYQYRITDKKADKRSPVCLACEAEAQAARLSSIRPER
jgi:NAD-dependent SIR2 family protein deacetylase